MKAAALFLFVIGTMFAQLGSTAVPLSVRMVDEKYWHQKPENWVAVGTVAIAVVAAFLAWRQVYLQRKTAELTMFEGVFRDIREHEKAFKERYELPVEEELAKRHPASIHERRDIENKYHKDLNATAFAFFNTVEYMAFLVNHGYITDKKLVTYFDRVLQVWFDRHRKFSDLDPVAEKTAFVEFKSLCKSRGVQ